jgi:hypothetical protein
MRGDTMLMSLDNHRYLATKPNEPGPVTVSPPPARTRPARGGAQIIMRVVPKGGLAVSAFVIAFARRLDLQADVFLCYMNASPDWPGVSNRVSLSTNSAPAGKFAVIIGTVGKSPLIDGLVKSGKVNADAISGKWESFIITTVANPMPGVDQALVIAGSDKRGTIYGIYEISEQIGVSPWYWWADVPPKHHENLFIKAGTYVQGPPVVKYRGIFINDEAGLAVGRGEIRRRQLENVCAHV